MIPALAASDLSPLYVILGYFALLIGLGVASSSLFRGTSNDYFVATRSIGPFLLLMSVFGTTMTAFALVGSTGKAYDLGIGVYGLMASSSGLIHSLVFFLVGIRLWAIGKRYGYVTQIQYFRARFQSSGLGTLLFPILVALVIPYLLIGLLGAGSVIRGVTNGMFPDTFAGVPKPSGDGMLFVGAVPPWLTGLVLCAVVLFYIFRGGLRGAAWANAFQTIVFMITGIIAFTLISNKLGGLEAATAAVVEKAPIYLSREGLIGYGQFRHLFVGAAFRRHVSSLVSALAHGEERKDVSTQHHLPSAIHHDCLGAVHSDRDLGAWNGVSASRWEFQCRAGDDGGTSA